MSMQIGIEWLIVLAISMAILNFGSLYLALWLLKRADAKQRIEALTLMLEKVAQLGEQFETEVKFQDIVNGLISDEERDRDKDVE